MTKKITFPKYVDYICYTPERYERIKNESSIEMDALDSLMEVAV